MGFFDASYITTVGTSVSRLVPDNQIVSSSKQGLITGIFSEGDQLIPHILDSINSGMGQRAERMYYAAKANYAYGLPSGTFFTSSTGKSVVLGVVRAEVGATATESYYHFGPINALHVGWHTLASDYAYDSVTNEIGSLSTIKGTPVYLKDMVVVIEDATLAERTNGSLEQWGRAASSGLIPSSEVGGVPVRATGLEDVKLPTAFRVDSAAVGDSILVTYVWWETSTTFLGQVLTVVDGNTVITNPGVAITKKNLHEATLSIPMASYAMDADYFHVKYLLAGKEGYWLYKSGSGTHLEIDSIFEVTPNSAGDFFPRIYFRYDKTSMAANTAATGYVDSNKLAKQLGLDYADVIANVHDNPNIADVEQAYLTFAVPATTTNQLEMRYLFDFFNKYYLASGGVGVDPGWELGAYAPAEFGDFQSPQESTTSKLLKLQEIPKINLSIHDSRLHMGISCQGIFKRKKAGVIAAVGAYTSSFTTTVITANYTRTEMTGPPAFWDGGPTAVQVPHTADFPIDSHIYRYQVSSATYEELEVYDMKVAYNVFGGFNTVGNDTDAIMLIPLDHAITGKYGTLDREHLYTRSLHFVFNSRQVQKVEWYQTGVFANFLMVVALVISVVSMGTDGGTAYAAAIAAGVPVTAALMQVVIGFALEFLKKWFYGQLFFQFAKAVGIQVAFIIAALALLRGAYVSMQAGLSAEAGKFISAVKNAPWAKELLWISSNLTQSINAVISKDLAGLQEEAKAFALEIEDKYKRLDAAKEELNSSSLLSCLFIPGETCDDFYNRTIHFGNIGTVGVSNIQHYVDDLLTLPKPHQLLT